LLSSARKAYSDAPISARDYILSAGDDALQGPLDDHLTKLLGVLETAFDVDGNLKLDPFLYGGPPITPAAAWTF